MQARKLSSRTLVAYTGSDAFVDRTQIILARLGYRIIDAGDYESVREELGERAVPDLLVVDDRRLDDVPRSGDLAEIPMVLLSGRGDVSTKSAQVLGSVKRPAGLHELYRLVQQIFEDSPRSTPRVDTDIPVQCDWRGRRWQGSLISISDNGGLLQGFESLVLGSRFELSFALPETGPLALEADVAYQLVPNVGIVFSAVAPATREAIAAYVEDSLSA